MGAILTALSVISPFKLVAPGAVVLGGYGDRRVLGVVGSWGPLLNLAMSTIMAPIVFLVPYGYLIWPAYYINTFIAVFNLVPISVLDGKKVFDWNKVVWAAMISYSILHLIIAMYL